MHKTFMLRQCSGCGVTVARRDCHKNRYGEYLCRTCQAAGMRFSRTAPLRRWLGQTPAIVLWSLAGTALIALAIWALYAAMLGLESLDFWWPEDKP